jgi:DNA-binding MarR family transcriptional regulator
MDHDVDIGMVRASCTCLRARRAARRLTQIYDGALAPVELTVNQFGLLAHLDGAGGLSIGALADAIGKHPSTVNRDLKPLRAQKLVADASDPVDRRVRAVAITAEGRARLRKALPLWRRAQARVRDALGAEVMRELNQLLDLTAARLKG